jgi:hypothetical protein
LFLVGKPSESSGEDQARLIGDRETFFIPYNQ